MRRKFVDSAFLRGIGSIMDLSGAGGMYLKYRSPVSLKRKRETKTVSGVAATPPRSMSSNPCTVAPTSAKVASRQEFMVAPR